MLTLSRTIPFGTGFLTHLSRTSCSSTCGRLSGRCFIVLLKSACSRSSLLAPASYSEFRWWVKPRCLWPRSGRHAGPRDQDRCDRPAAMLGGPHNSFCKQMGIYQLDHRLPSGLCNPIIGFRFKQVIKTAARASAGALDQSVPEPCFKGRPYECKECSSLAHVTLSAFACTIRHSTGPLTLSEPTCMQGDRFGCQSMWSSTIIAGGALSTS